MSIEKATRPLRATLRFRFASYLLTALICGLSSGVSAQDLDEVTKLIANNGGAYDFMGGAVAMSGDTLVVGGGANSLSESVYVFVRDASGAWAQEAELRATGGGASDDLFGISVAIDHNTIVVGAEEADQMGGCGGICEDVGAAYVFSRDGSGSWDAGTKLMASSAGMNPVGIVASRFGASVAVSGSWVLVGARGDDFRAPDAGAVYAFRRTGSSWIEQQRLFAADGQHSDAFGWAIALENNVAIIGARQDDDLGSSMGAAYVFEYIGSSWIQQPKLHGNRSSGTGDLFGSSIALSGGIAIIGAPERGGRGAAFVFGRQGSSWMQQRELSAGSSGDRFGEAVAVSAGRALVGAPNHATNGYASGAAYLYAAFSGSLQQKLSASDAAATDYFGGAVALAGNVGAVGARGDDNFSTNMGSVYVFAPGGDEDGDGVLDSEDNCPQDVNADQADNDGDGAGDVCDGDDDNDGVPDTFDICPSGDDNANVDGDALPDACDACPNDSDNDADGDGICGDLDSCSGDNGSGDSDNDGICDDSDICFGNNVTDDTDGDGICNDQDLCEGQDSSGDSDADGICDNWDLCTGDDASGDSDADGFCDDEDACAGDDASGDSDGDGVCDDSDGCPLDAENDSDGDGVCADLDQCLGDDASGDDDGDQVCNDQDFCFGNDSNGDSDGDLICDGTDNCPNTVNLNQDDADGDQIGDACEADSDADGVIDDNDNCVDVINADQSDTDGDLVGDSCDEDDDNDGVEDGSDNCPLYANPDQADADQDGFGDDCDGDDDADGVLDDIDLCPGTPLNAVFNLDGCSGAQFVELHCGVPADYDSHQWNYLRCVVVASRTAYREGLLTRYERARIVRHAAWSAWRAMYRRRLSRWR